MPDIRTISNSILFADINRIIDEGGKVTLRIKGHSMRPFLRNGRDDVVLNHIASEDIRQGMVVLFRHSKGHVLHRVRYIHGNTFIMKGDGNCRTAEHATADDIIAYAEAVIRNGHTIAYRSLHWRLLTAYSLAIKIARTAYHDIIAPILKRGTNI